MSDLIDRQKAIDALWKALYEYEDKTEKQFQESDELDISEWILHRIFVQNMSDIDRQTILDAPGIDAVPVVRCKDCKHLFDGEHNANCCDVLMEKAKWITEITVDDNWYCGDGERRDDGV